MIDTELIENILNQKSKNLNIKFSTTCMNNVKNKIKYTNILCRITLLCIFLISYFMLKCSILGTDVMWPFVHYSHIGNKNIARAHLH